jgi:alpha-L-fucosidase 2
LTETAIFYHPRSSFKLNQDAYLLMNKTKLISILLLLGISLQSMVLGQNIPEKINDKEFDPANLLWYETPADKWEKALPVGNGRLGAMVFGKYGEEIIQLNEETYWSGGPYSTVVSGGAKYLPEIQKLIFDGEPVKAHKLFGRHLMGYPVEQQKYQSLANLHLFFKNHEEVTEYRRWLDLKAGITGVQYIADGVTYRREVIASAPDQVIMVRLTANKPGRISFKAQLRGCRNQAHSNYATDYFQMDGVGSDGLMVNGKSADYLGIEGKIRYKAQLKAIPEGGKIRVEDDYLIIDNADAVTLYVVAATNFVKYNDVTADHEQRVKDYIEKINGKSYEEMVSASVDDHQKYFNRVSIELPLKDNSFLPTDQRINRIETDPDPNLAALCYNFARYILITSSRPGTQPANLQGIWNNSMNPAWDSKYTTNINTEMNYWPASSGNLFECFEPLTTMVKELTDQGSQVAKEHYGARGWVFHQNTDLWRVAAPMDGPCWGTFTVGGAWLTNQLYDHYLYTQNEEYLMEIYPLMKGSVQFFLDFLIEDPQREWLVTNPSTSPENPPEGPGYEYFFDEVIGFWYFTTICYGSSIDIQILTDLFDNYIATESKLGADRAMISAVQEARSRLSPPRIGKDGTLQEWSEDYAQLEDKHRHFSHLYGLYPGNVISVKRTPQYIDACKAVLNQRGDGGKGFSMGWKMALWARLLDGNRAYTVFKKYLQEQCYPQLFAKCGDPLQIDGTMGVAAGITEMLVQSHEEIIELLPALPDVWLAGRFDGVCVRGGFELDFKWQDQAIYEVEILSKAGKLCRINPGGNFRVTENGKRVVYQTNDDGSIEFNTSKNGVYKMVRK